MASSRTWSIGLIPMVFMILKGKRLEESLQQVCDMDSSSFLSILENHRYKLFVMSPF
jgi:hypothetical protein